MGQTSLVYGEVQSPEQIAGAAITQQRPFSPCRGSMGLGKGHSGSISVASFGQAASADPALSLSELPRG